MSEWKEYKLGEIASFVKEKISVQEIGLEDYISTENMLADKGGITTASNKPNEGTITRFFPNTILISNIRPYFKKIWFSDRYGGCSNDVLCFEPTKKLVDDKYLFFLLSQDVFFDYVMLGSKGCKMPRGDKSHIMNWEVSLPPLDTQRRISAILSSLDDKIDLLHRENATLEQMAETLFRQWFVVERKEEWEEGKLGDWVVIKRGGSPRPINDYLSPTGYRWLKISDVTNLNSPYIFQTKEYIKESGLSKTVYLKKGSLVLSNSATPGIPQILCVDSCIHDGWLYFPKSTFSKIYLYLLFKYIRKDLVNLGNGSIFTNLKTDILKEYKVVKPDAKTMEVFDQQVQPIFDKLYSNETQIQTLIQTRDGLLPRLMSGELNITEI